MKGTIDAQCPTFVIVRPVDVDGCCFASSSRLVQVTISG